MARKHRGRGKPVIFDEGGYLTDEAASRAAGATNTDSAGPRAVGSPATDTTVGGHTIFSLGRSPDEVLRVLRATSDMRNTGVKVGGITQAPDDAEYWAALHPGATSEQVAQQAKNFKQYGQDIIPEGKKGFRGWARDHPLGMIAAFTAAAAGGAGLSGLGGGGASTGAGAGAGAGTTGSGLGIFSQGGVGGLTGVGSGDMSALVAGGTTGAGAGAGALGTLKGLGSAAVKMLLKNPKAAMGILSMMSGSGKPKSSGSIPSPSSGQGSDVLPVSTYSRERSAVPQDLTRYGMGPEHAFFKKTGLADGGALSATRHYPSRPKGDSEPRNFVSHGTGAGGREDNIDAKLSENEYVVDAETVALLGDGSPEMGAKKLDKMRGEIRRHKGQALAKGKISPHAKEGALQYLAKGGKVRSVVEAVARRALDEESAIKAVHYVDSAMDNGDLTDEEYAQALRRVKNLGERGARKYSRRPPPPLLKAKGGKVSGALSALFKRKPKTDPNAHLHRLNAILEEALKKKPEPELRRATSEELDRDVADLRREVGAQGGDTRPLGRPGPITRAAGGRVPRPRQSLNAAMDQADSAFDIWRKMQKPLKRPVGADDYERRQRIRVGTTTHDLGTMPHWMAKNLGGNK